MKIIISNSSSVPIYEQIKNTIINQIMNDELKEDETLPSIRNLAQDIKISVMTIKKAYDELEQEGYIISRQGKGTFVAPKNVGLAKEQAQKEIEEHITKIINIADKFEIKKDEIIHPLPAYTPGFDGWDDPLRKTYPLQLTGFHYKARTHSSYGNIDVLQQACPQEVWINPIDAQARGIRHGDTVRVFNNNGEMLIAAKVTPRILPGVTAIGQGAWLKADMFGDRVDHGGSINILTSHRPSPLAKGNPSHSNLVQIEKV